MKAEASSFSVVFSTEHRRYRGWVGCEARVKSGRTSVFSLMTRFLPDCCRLKMQPGISCQPRKTLGATNGWCPSLYSITWNYWRKYSSVSMWRLMRYFSLVRNRKNFNHVKLQFSRPPLKEKRLSSKAIEQNALCNCARWINVQRICFWSGMQHEGFKLLESRLTFGPHNPLAAVCQLATLNSLETDESDGWMSGCLAHLLKYVSENHCFEKTAMSVWKRNKKKSQSSTSFACFNYSGAKKNNKNWVFALFMFLFPTKLMLKHITACNVIRLGQFVCSVTVRRHYCKINILVTSTGEAHSSRRVLALSDSNLISLNQVGRLYS